MRKSSILLFVIVIIALFFAVAALAQGPGVSQFNQFREQHKYTFQLMSMVRHISVIDKDKKNTLTPDQARKVLAVLKPLRSKPKLTQDQARNALKELKKVFNANQLNAMARIKDTRPGGQRTGQAMGQRPGGMNGTGGTRRNNGNNQRPRMDINAMKNFNPFYVDAKSSSSNQMAAGMSKRWNDFFAGLEKKAKQSQQAQPVKKTQQKQSTKSSVKKSTTKKQGRVP